MPTLSRKGQVTIPKAIRDFLGLKPGSAVAFEVDVQGRVLIKARTPRPKSVFARLRGTAKAGLTTDQLMALIRGEDQGHAGRRRVRAGTGKDLIRR
jgi:AbrB family looped-hinge helix DNA binding protein